MKPIIRLMLATCALVLNAHGQRTLVSGEVFSHTFTALAGSPGAGMWHPGWVFAYFAPNSVQTDDVVRLEMFEGNLDDTLIFSGTYTNTATVAGFGTAFAWWDKTGSFRLTVLTGSVILDQVSVLVSTGPIACPCTGFGTNIVLEPNPRVWVTPQPGGQVRLAWETNYPAFNLESTRELSSTAWAPVTNSVVRDGSYFTVSLPGDEAQRYFRIRKD